MRLRNSALIGACLMSVLLCTYFVNVHWKQHYFYLKLTYLKHIERKNLLDMYGLRNASRDILGTLADDYLNPRTNPDHLHFLIESIAYHDQEMAVLVATRGLCSNSFPIFQRSAMSFRVENIPIPENERACFERGNKAPLLRAYRRVYGSTVP